ncbi:MAG: pyridoxal phosphate-dependent aminotransferase [Symploca sp. SIO2G7]|nr:pyridoxal phosphate-dependent aminotransferase [Symploca sp. SIO2G7]
MGTYSTKVISQAAKEDSSILNLSIGEPEFGPPQHLLSEIDTKDLTLTNFLESVNRYEQSRGSAALRNAISEWYMRRYGIAVDPDKEIIITHGGVGAITLAILSATRSGDTVAIGDPSYMLYKRTIAALGRNPAPFLRLPANEEYREVLNSMDDFSNTFGAAKAIVINSPENPTGYVVSKTEWNLLTEMAEKNDAWIIHDEVYDTMAFSREHFPARSVDTLGERTILVNSFSKKFGTPGLRIGWMVANERLIKIASKAHDYLYLGVNILYERIAARLISDPSSEEWFTNMNRYLSERTSRATRLLNREQGFTWERSPMGAMFLFPNVSNLYETIPADYKIKDFSISESVAKYLVHKHKIAAVPGSVYGTSSDANIRLVLCSPSNVYDKAITRLANINNVPVGANIT